MAATIARLAFNVYPNDSPYNVTIYLLLGIDTRTSLMVIGISGSLFRSRLVLVLQSVVIHNMHCRQRCFASPVSSPYVMLLIILDQFYKRVLTPWLGIQLPRVYCNEDAGTRIGPWYYPTRCVPYVTGLAALQNISGGRGVQSMMPYMFN